MKFKKRIFTERMKNSIGTKEMLKKDEYDSKKEKSFENTHKLHENSIKKKSLKCKINVTQKRKTFRKY